MKKVAESKSLFNRVAVGKTARKLCFLGGIAMLTGGAFWSILNARTVEQTVEQTRYSYAVTADAAFAVCLYPNNLFPDVWLKEDRVYPEKLTDYIEVTMTALFQGSEEADISGTYRVDGVVTGYQSSGEKEVTVYETKFPLKAEPVAATTGSEAAVKTVLQVRPDVYRQYAVNAETVLGQHISRRLSLLFTGSFTANTPYGPIEKKFSYTLPIPLGDGTTLYTIEKPAPVSEEDSLKESMTSAVRPYIRMLLPSILFAVVGAALTAFAKWGTRPRDADEMWRRQMCVLLKKFGSRMIPAERLPEPSPGSVTVVVNLENLLFLAEEIRRPVLYCPQADGLPRDGTFYVEEQRNCYCFRLPRPESTPLVLDDVFLGGKERDPTSV